MNVIGLMFNRNEADILEEVITTNLPYLDSLFIADDGSTDGSWEIIKHLKRRYPKIEYTRQSPDPNDQGQKKALLDEIKRRYRWEDTWVQICESDIVFLDTCPRTLITQCTGDDIKINWHCLNAVRKPGTWAQVDSYPNWKEPIQSIMTYAHLMEKMTYTFKPAPFIDYTSNVWRPWPQGFSNYKGTSPISYKERPLLLHYGYRGPTHFYKKFLGKRTKWDRYPTWDVSSVEAVERTVSWFNGEFNNDRIFPASRYGYLKCGYY